MRTIIPFIFTSMMLILIIAFFSVGQALYHDDNTQNITQIVDNVSIVFDDIKEGVNITYPYEDRSIKRVFNVVDHTFDFFIGITEEAFGFGVEFGYEHPEYNYTSVIYFIKLVYIIFIVAALFMPIIVIAMLIVMLVQWIKDKKIKRKQNGKQKTRKNKE